MLKSVKNEEGALSTNMNGTADFQEMKKAEQVGIFERQINETKAGRRSKFTDSSKL